jgi:hypothetical protein
MIYDRVGDVADRPSRAASHISTRSAPRLAVPAAQEASMAPNTHLKYLEIARKSFSFKPTLVASDKLIFTSSWKRPLGLALTSPEVHFLSYLQRIAVSYTWNWFVNQSWNRH